MPAHYQVIEPSIRFVSANPPPAPFSRTFFTFSPQLLGSDPILQMAVATRASANIQATIDLNGTVISLMPMYPLPPITFSPLPLATVSFIFSKFLLAFSFTGIALNTLRVLPSPSSPQNNNDVFVGKVVLFSLPS